MIKIQNFNDKGEPYQDYKIVDNPLQCEISTMWLGVENEGMNIAIYKPMYKTGGEFYEMIMCVFPKGRFEMEWYEDEQK